MWIFVAQWTESRSIPSSTRELGNGLGQQLAPVEFRLRSLVSSCGLSAELGRLWEEALRKTGGSKLAPAARAAELGKTQLGLCGVSRSLKGEKKDRRKTSSCSFAAEPGIVRADAVTADASSRAWSAPAALAAELSLRSSQDTRWQVAPRGQVLRVRGGVSRYHDQTLP